jgi:hypothetical protein
MKNIHLIPTDKPSRIYLIKSNNKLGITSNNPEFTENFGSGTQKQHIYITNDKEIKVGDWYYLPRTNSVYKCIEDPTELNLERRLGVAKIILTTDQDLIKNGVQAIDDDFLEWFINNPSCENVEVKTFCCREISKNYCNLTCGKQTYKIIIPKEEPKQSDWEFEISSGYHGYRNKITGDWIYESEYFKIFNNPKQETLEEAAEKYAKTAEGIDIPYQNGLYYGFVEGAKWQVERMYGETEVLELLKKSHFVEQNIEEWFEQHKKK